MGARWAVIRNHSSFSRQMLHGAVDNGAEFRGVLRLAPFCQSPARLLDAEPGGVAHGLVRRLGASHFQQEGLHDEFLDAAGLPEDAFGVEVKVKMSRLDHADSPSLLQRLALRRLTVR